jgi:hypothetical protein
MDELLVDELVDPQRSELAADTGSLGAAKRQLRAAKFGSVDPDRRAPR